MTINMNQREYIRWERRKIPHNENTGSLARSALSIRGIVANALAAKGKAPSKLLECIISGRVASR